MLYDNEDVVLRKGSENNRIFIMLSGSVWVSRRLKVRHEQHPIHRREKLSKLWETMGKLSKRGVAAARYPVEEAISHPDAERTHMHDAQTIAKVRRS